MSNATASAAAAAAVTTALTRVLRDYRGSAAQGPGGPPEHAARERAALALEQAGWPSNRDEQWRYANLRALERVASFQPVARVATAATAVSSAAALQDLPPPLPGFTRLVFVDGIRHEPLALPAGVRSVAPPGAQAAQWSAAQRLGWLGEMFATDTAALAVAGEAALELLFVTSAASAQRAVYPRLQLELGAGSRLQLVERHLGAPAGPTLVAGTATIDLARGALLTHYRTQQCGALVSFTESLDVRVGEDAQYRVRHAALGAHDARTSARVRLAGREARLQWHALAVGRGEQVQDTALQVLHGARGTGSEQVFRGIADERARLAFSGHVQIDASAPGSEARQSLRGLIAGPAAEIDLRPRLEISIDEVRATHGATTGRLDENLLFYLLARGLDPDTARALLKWAFLGDVLREVTLPALRTELERLAAGLLPDVLAAGAVA
jgi:Fe-S cluster assembly protein SufD